MMRARRAHKQRTCSCARACAPSSYRRTATSLAVYLASVRMYGRARQCRSASMHTHMHMSVHVHACACRRAVCAHPHTFHRHASLISHHYSIAVPLSYYVSQHLLASSTRCYLPPAMRPPALPPTIHARTLNLAASSFHSFFFIGFLYFMMRAPAPTISVSYPGIIIPANPSTMHVSAAEELPLGTRCAGLRLPTRETQSHRHTKHQNTSRQAIRDTEARRHGDTETRGYRHARHRKKKAAGNRAERPCDQRPRQANQQGMDS